MYRILLPATPWDEIAVLELAEPTIRYTEARAEETRTNAEQRAARAVLRAAEEDNQPLAHLREEVKAEKLKFDRKRTDAKARVSRKYVAMKRKKAEEDEIERKTEESQAQLESHRENEKARLTKIRSLKAKVAESQNILDNPPVMEDPVVIGQDIRDVNAKLRDHQKDWQDHQDKQRQCGSRGAEIRSELHAVHAEEQALNDVNKQRIRALGRWDPDAGRACEWLLEHLGRFEMEVFLPPCVSVSVPNGAFIGAVENCFNSNQIRTFVTQCEADYKLLNTLINDTTEVFGRKMRINTWFRPRLREHLPAPPVSRERLSELGFDGYALDYVNCPDGLRWYLERELNMHRVAVALDPGSVDPTQAMEALSSNTSTMYIIGNVINTVSRSSYGRKNLQNLTRAAKLPRNLKQDLVDNNALAILDERRVVARNNLDGYEAEMGQLATAEATLKGKQDDLQGQLEAAKTRKQKLVGQREALEKAALQISTCRKRIEEEEAAPSFADEQRKLVEELRTAAIARAKIGFEFRDLIQAAMRDHLEIVGLGLEVVQRARNMAALDVLADEHAHDLGEKRRASEEANAIYAEAKANSHRLAALVVAALGEASAELRKRFDAIPAEEKAKWTLAEIEERKDVELAKLAANHATNPGIIAEYDGRQKEIESLEAKVQEREANARRADSKTIAVRNKWYPALKELVASISQKFSAAFDRINCAGEVRISEHQDFEKWAIHIMVKFRDSEKLQPLTAQRQSGGERSLSTILYLLSLTEMAHAPFSLVDEINQGMDQRAERAVHNQLVNATCAADSGQYFLITPKLLSGLDYHPKMKILTVYNGEWMPEVPVPGDMMALLQAYRGPAANTNQVQTPIGPAAH